MRIATGCLKMADVGELYQEAWELRVRLHDELISQQCVLVLHLSQHPSHQLSYTPPNDRPDRRRSLIDRLNLASSNTSPTSHSTTRAKSRLSAASTKMRSELPLNAAHHYYLMADAAHFYSRTDTAKEDKNYTVTNAHRSKPNPWSVHNQNRPDSAQPLPRLWSFAS